MKINNFLDLVSYDTDCIIIDAVTKKVYDVNLIDPHCYKVMCVAVKDNKIQIFYLTNIKR